MKRSADVLEAAFGKEAVDSLVQSEQAPHSEPTQVIPEPQPEPPPAEEAGGISDIRVPLAPR